MGENLPESHQSSSLVTSSTGNSATADSLTNQRDDTAANATRKRSHLVGAHGHSREGSEPVDAGALSRALQGVERETQSRERTPVGSPSRKRQRIYGDRFIPNRDGRDLQASFSLLPDNISLATPRTKKRTPHGELHFQRSMVAPLNVARITSN